MMPLNIFGIIKRGRRSPAAEPEKGKGSPMSLANILTAVTLREDIESAQAMAAILNADRTNVQLLEGRTHFTAEDILRIGRIASEYNPANSSALASALLSELGSEKDAQ